MMFIQQSFLFLSLLVCVSRAGDADQNSNLNMTMTPSTAEHHLADAVNSLGYELMTNMMKQNVNHNIVMSPAGIAGLLAMTLLGSVGESYDELAQTLGFSQDILQNRKNHEDFGNLLQSLNFDDNSTRTSYADAIFVDDNAKIRGSYRNYLNSIYHGDVLPVNFNDVAKAKHIINEWVSTNTNGKIDDFLKDPLPMSTKITLLTALYFKGQWKKPFVPEYTNEMIFKTPSGRVNASLMLNFGFFDYTHSFHDGLHMIALPYNDSVNTMYVLMPRGQKYKNITELMDSLDYAKINQLVDKMNIRECVIRYPKMEVNSKLNLEESLKELGIKSIFSQQDANFALMIEGHNKKINATENELISRINNKDLEEVQGINDKLKSLPNPGVYIDSVLHTVKISINEFGTEAAAATSGVLARSAELFYADSPFYMFIRNEITKLVTFSAVIYDPTE